MAVTLSTGLGTTYSVASRTASGSEVQTVDLANIGPSTGTQSSVASATTDATILASNASRKGAMVFNDDANVLYLLLASGTSSAANYSVQVAANDLFELPLMHGGVYTGVIKGLWAADGSGSARVTEFT